MHCCLLISALYCASIPFANVISLICVVFAFAALLHCLLQGKDDITGEPLIQHDDDKPQALMARLRHYKDVAKPVIDLYKSVNTCTSFDLTLYFVIFDICLIIVIFK